MATKDTGRKGEHVQGAPKSQHDVPHDSGGATKVPDASNLEQGTKPSELRDAGDRSSNPSPSKKSSDRDR